MKKAILPLMLLIIGVSLVALESAPSDVVGFVKVPCGAGFTPFAVPFTCYDGSGVETMALADIVGPYMTGGMPFNADKVWNITDNSTSYKATTGAFVGFQDFTNGHAYLMQNKHTAFDMYIAGKVEQEVVDYGTMGMGFNAVGFKDAGMTSLNDLDLLASGFTGGMPFNSDKIWDLTNNSTAYYSTISSSWVGFTTITPGHAYLIQVKNSAFTWVYDPTTRGEDTTPQFETQNTKNTRR